ncbi:FAD-dependent monooxygenase [Streptomyces sp. ML-6]|uniref:NAD(P)/FAD-dependent oxidoreductase n=1 Tax=Streptomyces sp. ML-6 TaxID=2982693 RepID=UPI0024BF67B2|nr:FAD-dependent monooxygenase [Streptomyces sp. ML-6]MDK0517981.1 FAD-dependent monooxygenase [Streptomyces sp. ML-6]
MYDVVVIGARCAGAATALLLAESGQRVLMVDQARFPSDTMSTLYIHQPGVARLRDWGILDPLLETGCPRLVGLSHTVGPVTVSGPLPAYEGIDFAVAPRRRVLDQVVVDAARDAGAEFRARTKLVDVVRRDGRVSGVLLRGPEGGVTQETSRVVVGADGMRSALARLCGARTTTEDARRTCVYYSGWHIGGDQVRLVEAQDAYVGVIPTHDGVSLVSTFAPQSMFEHARTDPMAFHLEMIDALAPDLGDRLRQTEPVLRLTGTGDQQNFFREASGKGWALVGDAGHHKDSITARGITDAFLQAELLGQVLAGRCGSDRSVDTALAEFARRRNGLLRESYAATLTAAGLGVTDSRLALHEEIGNSATLTQVYLGVLAGMRSAEELVCVEPDTTGPRGESMSGRLV